LEEKESKAVSSKVDIVIVSDAKRERIKSAEKIPGPAVMLLHVVRVLLLWHGKGIRLVFRRLWARIPAGARIFSADLISLSLGIAVTKLIYEHVVLMH